MGDSCSPCSLQYKPYLWLDSKVAATFPLNSLHFYTFVAQLEYLFSSFLLSVLGTGGESQDVSSIKWESAEPVCVYLPWAVCLVKQVE